MLSANLGFPRIGKDRELKKAVESYWSGATSEAQLLEVAAHLRAEHWRLQLAAGIDSIPSNDFSLYDQMLDMSVALGVIPPRFATLDVTHLQRYFLMARGQAPGVQLPHEIKALEMTKWFDTNYHYLTPEFEPNQTFTPDATKPLAELREAQALGIATRPVVIGPVTYLSLGKLRSATGDRLDLLDALLPAYVELLRQISTAGATWVQIDEPILATDLSDKQRESLVAAYRTIAAELPQLNVMLATYFGPLAENLSLAANLSTAGLHVDLVRGKEDAASLVDVIPAGKVVSLGLVEGRNIWRTNAIAALAFAQPLVDQLGADRVQIAPSCSLLHAPVDLDAETDLDDELKSWLAFGKQKLAEVKLIATAILGPDDATRAALEANRQAMISRQTSERVISPQVQGRVAFVDEHMQRRRSSFPQRRSVQQASLGLPAFPTTTIGSFPQTAEIRQARAKRRKGELSHETYVATMQAQIREVIAFQEEVGLDLLVHGEPERNDMVEYFGESLAGFAITRNGWVQSYGSRCVKPPIIYGDVSRPRPMTVEWIEFAQSCSTKPVKGMLTGPVTILCWSFVRDDQPRSETARQIALAIRDEVEDLEKAGVRVIQIDEPALREGLPLRKRDWNAYLEWAGDSFRLASSVVADETQIHTHMCYCEFNDIIEAIAGLDADVISIETSRSDMELLDAFVDFRYPNEIGPGVFDIHSPQAPTSESMFRLLTKAAEVLNPSQIWVNPDCGLKTRKWEEVRPALTNMVKAAEAARQSLAT
ncbi:5-methyltetrahydropteroyltriglutamate--homocysteine S-methyltransferase [Blastopirellula sp. JC732]|uniref:5-methyltetrahydropteroyltriglutamate--homocysteine methyltransferase n=1 Tax=Blastopirellula sediminis TaxID=2894196 RepID=A0A9X1MHK3_9BACT|nr:5-methyltetrahydropteroyltriglutamate--homocysteine S-methyltransferase [Blastopirellula sediminis]MCC9608123.1 5-methyltetrahydropteroyltriglutamate--homocysteine S-methyltransferase [Blastopirellula sediminis]MCC9627084.1 5-methyltetrahydropteroyltriglutamate--homocysteine S-methyltransferase [Blastopirellula sediminis]